MSDEWVELGRVEVGLGSVTRAAVVTALKCRRHVAVRFDSLGVPCFYARVPLPKAVQKALGVASHAKEGSNG